MTVRTDVSPISGNLRCTFELSISEQMLQPRELHDLILAYARKVAETVYKQLEVRQSTPGMGY